MNASKPQIHYKEFTDAASQPAALCWFATIKHAKWLPLSAAGLRAEDVLCPDPIHASDLLLESSYQD
jgi:hypothetical protein